MIPKHWTFCTESNQFLVLYSHQIKGFMILLLSQKMFTAHCQVEVRSPFPVICTPLSVYPITAVLPWHFALSHFVQGHIVWKETKQNIHAFFYHLVMAIICTLKAELSQGLQKMAFFKCLTFSIPEGFLWIFCLFFVQSAYAFSCRMLEILNVVLK